MNKEVILRHFITVLLTLMSSVLLNNSIFENKTFRIDNDDFSIVESSIVTSDSTVVKSFFIKNNTSFPINNNNFKIKYSSDNKPISSNYTTANDEYIPIEIRNNQKLLIEEELPDKLKNEDYFTISVFYKANEILNDKLLLTIESPKDNRYVNISNSSNSINTFIGSSRTLFYNYRSLVIILSFIIIYYLFLKAYSFVIWLIDLYKKEKDKNFINNRNKKQFLKR